MLLEKLILFRSIVQWLLPTLAELNGSLFSQYIFHLLLCNLMGCLLDHVYQFALLISGVGNVLKEEESKAPLIDALRAIMWLS